MHAPFLFLVVVVDFAYVLVVDTRSLHLKFGQNWVRSVIDGVVVVVIVVVAMLFNNWPRCQFFFGYM